ncbi:MAG: hypothetical protein RBT80_06295 [Candidatus Vecturithrix sp.]|nr:hypothetical protein [Candidatus Vecturithrix sp.]
MNLTRWIIVTLGYVIKMAVGCGGLDRGKVVTFTQDGKPLPLLISGSHQNIIDRKQAEEALL